MATFSGLFDGIAPGTGAALDATRRSRSFGKGDDLLTIGVRPQSMYYVRSGRVKAWRPNRDGVALTLDYFGRGEALGLVAVSRRAPMRVTMTAVSRVETDYWPATTILRLLDEDALFTHNGLRIVGKALDVLTDRIEDATSANAEQRIGRALLRLASEHATWTSDHEAAVDVSRQEISDLTGSTLFTASRVLSEWDRQGLVKSLRGRVVIRDPETLATIAEG